GSRIEKAFHITASSPVAAYDIFPYGGGRSAISSATLLLPTSAWRTSYIGVAAYAMPPVETPDFAHSPFLAITAASDGTKVTILPTAAIQDGIGVAATPAGRPKTYDLERGQVLQLTQPEELTGSTIQANKPIGVWGGHQ